MIEAGLSSEVIDPLSPVPPKSAFAGFRYPPEVIVIAVRWYLRFNLSLSERVVRTVRRTELSCRPGRRRPTGPNGGRQGPSVCQPGGPARRATCCSGRGPPLHPCRPLRRRRAACRRADRQLPLQHQRHVHRLKDDQPRTSTPVDDADRPCRPAVAAQPAAVRRHRPPEPGRTDGRTDGEHYRTLWHSR
jgi:hypothetical protein